MSNELFNMIFGFGRAFLFFNCGFFFLSSVIYMLKGENDKWFSRVALGSILLGLSLILVKRK